VVYDDEMDVDSADDMDYLPSSGETADSVDAVDHDDEAECVSVGEGEVIIQFYFVLYVVLCNPNVTQHC